MKIMALRPNELSDRNPDPLGIEPRQRDHVVMYVIGIRLTGLEQLQPCATRAKQHSECKADLRLSQTLAQTVPGACAALAKYGER